MRGEFLERKNISMQQSTESQSMFGLLWGNSLGLISCKASEPQQSMGDFLKSLILLRK